MYKNNLLDKNSGKEDNVLLSLVTIISALSPDFEKAILIPEEAALLSLGLDYAESLVLQTEKLIADIEKLEFLKNDCSIMS